MIDFMFLTETWLNENGTATLLEAAPENYRFMHTVNRAGEEGEWPAFIIVTLTAKAPLLVNSCLLLLSTFLVTRLCY